MRRNCSTPTSWRRICATARPTGSTAPVPSAGGEVYIYVLLEHKSAPDPEVGVQLLGYLAEIWRRLDRQRLEQGGAVGS